MKNVNTKAAPAAPVSGEVIALPPV